MCSLTSKTDGAYREICEVSFSREFKVVLFGYNAASSRHGCLEQVKVVSSKTVVVESSNCGFDIWKKAREDLKLSEDLNELQPNFLFFKIIVKNSLYNVCNLSSSIKSIYSIQNRIVQYE